MPEAVTLGETCVVLVAKSEGLLRYIAEYERRPGGAESTVAAGIVRLGHTAGWISHVGNDEFGRYLLMLMRAEGVDTSRVKIVDERPTGIFFKERRPAGEARIFYYRSGSAAASMSPEDLDEDYIASARVLHLTGITPALSESCRRTVESAMEIARRCGVIITFDPNLRLKLWSTDKARPVLERLMSLADYVLPGLEDMKGLYGDISSEDILARLRKIGCKKIVLKLGAKGALLGLASKDTLITGYPVERPADTLGAGDAFAAGFIVGLLRDMPLEGAVDLGNRVASLSVRLPGNIESLPDWDTVSHFEKGGKPVMR